ncbi:ABC transporter transmembrane domain-containing protein, partial [Streptococcus pyogenes]
MMFINSVPLAVIGILGTPLSLVCVLVIVKISQKFFTIQQSSLGDINGHIEEMYSAHNVVSVFNAKDKAIEKFDEINKKLYKS